MLLAGNYPFTNTTADHFLVRAPRATYLGIDLEDETDGSLLLNGTDSSSTDAGERFRFELATDDNITINYPAV